MSAVHVYHVEKLVAQLGVLLKTTSKICHSHVAVISHASHALAQVFSLHHYGEALRSVVKGISQHVYYLSAQTLLQL